MAWLTGAPHWLLLVDGINRQGTTRALASGRHEPSVVIPHVLSVVDFMTYGRWATRASTSG